MKCLKILFLIGIVYLFYSFTNNNEGKINSGTSNNITQFYFFELTPLSSQNNLPIYFSQTIGITFSDNSDLLNQQSLYFHELMLLASKDGQDTLDYNEKLPPKSDNQDDCEANRLSIENILKNSGNTVIDKIIN